MVLPEVPILLQPPINLLQRRSIDGIEPPGSLGSYGGKAVVPQHLQMLGDCRLGDAELALDHQADGARGLLSVGQQLQDPAAHRVPKDVERVHTTTMSIRTYTFKSGVRPASMTR